MRTACSQGSMRSQSGQVSWIAPHRHRLLRTDGVLHAKGRTRVGYRYTAHSIIGSTFHCPIEAETMLEERPAVVPVISGQAWITGIHQHMLDLSDPYPSGYRLSDSWPMPARGDVERR